MSRAVTVSRQQSTSITCNCPRISYHSAYWTVVIYGRNWYLARWMMLQVFFVLRKKDRQVSFLHVYHHASQVLYTWAYLKYLPGRAPYTAVILVQLHSFCNKNNNILWSASCWNVLRVILLNVHVEIEICWNLENTGNSCYWESERLNWRIKRKGGGLWIHFYNADWNELTMNRVYWRNLC
jgi:hypothetical protein